MHLLLIKLIFIVPKIKYMLEINLLVFLIDFRSFKLYIYKNDINLKMRVKTFVDKGS